MPLNINYNGSVYTVPLQGENYGWGSGLTSYFQALSGSLAPGSGTFSLTQELDLGANYGIKSIYFKSPTALPALAGRVRLARADTISWRNQANTSDLPLGVNSTNQLTFNGQSVGSFLDLLDFNTAASNTNAVGRLKWNDAVGGVEMGLKGGNVTTVLTQDNAIRVVNQSGGTLAKGSVVRTLASNGSLPTVTAANSLSIVDASNLTTVGVTAEAIANGAEGFIITRGYIKNIDTTAYGGIAGSVLFLAQAGAGGISATPPTPPRSQVQIGMMITGSSATGTIFVDCRPNQNLGMLSDVNPYNPQPCQRLVYDLVSSKYVSSFDLTLVTTPASGGATILSTRYEVIVFNLPTSSIATHTITLPFLIASDVGRIFRFCISAAGAYNMTSVTMTSASGATIRTPITTLTPGPGCAFIYDGTQWCRLY